VTDPMRRPVAKDTVAPRPAAPAKPAIAPRVEASAPAEVNMDAPAPQAAPEPEPAEESVTVPVVLTRAQIRSGQPVRLLLDIRVKDE